VPPRKDTSLLLPLRVMGIETFRQYAELQEDASYGIVLPSKRILELDSRGRPKVPMDMAMLRAVQTTPMIAKLTSERISKPGSFSA